MTYSMESGPSNSVVFPTTGPFNERLGYTRMETFRHRLEQNGFRVSQQARFSPLLRWLAHLGITPPYRELPLSGLRISGEDLSPLAGGRENVMDFENYEAIPSLLVKSLLFIENRELENPIDISSSPVLEWDRIAKAAILYTGNKLGLPVPVEGGSTLVTQLEKYRYSEEGKTQSAFDKVRQLVSASLRVYRSGIDTRPVRQEIILDYLNTMPLSAAPGHGEVNGLGEGLQVWFGTSLRETSRDLLDASNPSRKAAAYRRTLSLLAAVRAPSYYLRDNREALDDRVEGYVRLLRRAGIVDSQIAASVAKARPEFVSLNKQGHMPFSPQRKALHSVRASLAQLLRTSDLYDLDRLDVEVKTTLDVALQNIVVETFANLRKREFLAAHGLLEEKLLNQGDPVKVIYGLTMFERTPESNLLRAHVDTYENPMDFNESIKLEMGSTAKLRTLAHYLEVVSLLYHEARNGKPLGLHKDPISVFVSDALSHDATCKLDTLLSMALERKYAGSPYETFWTGGGLHVFRNYDSDQDGRRMSVREATVHSNNLVFVRLMRDLVRFHEERLEYDPTEVLADRDHAMRTQLLEMAANEEARHILWRTFRECRNQPQEKVVRSLLGTRSQSRRHWAILFFGLQQEGIWRSGLSNWLDSSGQKSGADEVSRWTKVYGNPSLHLPDYAYLLGVHPLTLWCTETLLRNPKISWEQVWEQSSELRKSSSEWLFQKRQFKAQNLRLSTRIERDAFARMTPAWRRLGFPYEHMIPSLASAIGNSGDKPEALAQLMGIILNDGELKPAIEFKTLHFAPQTPYQTTFEVAGRAPRQVMEREVARALKSVLTGVVQAGTGRRVAGAFTFGGRPATVGGKTGTGDNRFKTYARGGALLSSRAVSRTASFVFFIENRYFGVVSASVLGEEAAGYTFTSALPVAVLKLLAPAINARLQPTLEPLPHETLQTQRPSPQSGATHRVFLWCDSRSVAVQSQTPRDSLPVDTPIDVAALPVDPSNLRWRRWSAMVSGA